MKKPESVIESFVLKNRALNMLEGQNKWVKLLIYKVDIKYLRFIINGRLLKRNG